MIRMLGSLPRNLTVAVSGGVDSMALLDFLSYNHGVECAFFHHGTETSDHAQAFLQDYCQGNKIKLHVGKISGECPAKLSLEEWWRWSRYEFLKNFDTVVTAHHLDDVAETWIWSSLHGTSKLMPYRHANVVRPVLLNRKFELERWAVKKNVPWVVDRSNFNLRFTRNYIRQELMPHALRVNPGLHTLLRKRLIERHKQEKNS